MQKFWKSVKIWQSYKEFKGGNYFETECILVLADREIVYSSSSVATWQVILSRLSSSAKSIG